jgi:hypothetical protein
MAPLSLQAKLKLATDISAFLAMGARGADLALDSTEWCPVLGHGGGDPRATGSSTWRKMCADLLTWARNSFPELEFELDEDERGRDPDFKACSWHLSVEVPTR